MVIIKSIAYFVRSLIRQLYWLYQLQTSTLGKGLKLSFPIIIEGKGGLVIGDYCQVGKYVMIKKAKGSKVYLGEKGILEDRAAILLNDNGNLIIGQNIKIGKATRLYVQNNWELGNDVKIETHCSIFSRESGFYGRLEIKNGTHIGDNTIIDVTDNVFIGSEVAIGPNCIIYTHDHDYTQKDKATWKGGVYTKPVSVGSGSWIGSGVTILPGVTIGNRCVVAAGSVVTKDLKDNSIYGGIPAKLIKAI